MTKSEIPVETTNEHECSRIKEKEDGHGATEDTEEGLAFIVFISNSPRDQTSVMSMDSRRSLSRAQPRGGNDINQYP